MANDGNNTTPGVIDAGQLYTMAEAGKRLRWAEHAWRQARAAGLRVVRFGRIKYVRGQELLRFFEELEDGE